MRMDEKNDLFWKLLEPEYEKALMFCRKLMEDREQGDDLFQDALVNAFVCFSDLRDTNSFRPWLYRIMVNTFRSTVRRPWWKRRIRLESVEDLPTESTNPIDQYTARRWLMKAFQNVSPTDQTLITLYELEEWTISELAELYGKSEGAIKGQLFRIRRKMQKTLRKYYRRERIPQTAINGEDRCAAVKQGLE